MCVSKKVLGFINLAMSADVIRASDSPLLTSKAIGVPNGDEKNEVLHLTWDNDGQVRTLAITEGEIERGSLDTETGWFNLVDADGNLEQVFLGKVIPVEVAVEGWV